MSCTEFEISFLEEVLGRDKSDMRVLENLAMLYTQTGQYKNGLQMDLRLYKLKPDDGVVNYNLACSYALCGFFPEAINHLDDAVHFGYDDFDHLINDEDLFPLREYQPFHLFLKNNGIDIGGQTVQKA